MSVNLSKRHVCVSSSQGGVVTVCRKSGERGVASSYR